ncbi:MAG: PP2C family serine/threonine-protein phosphatase [Atopobiaceae bacterium]|nr:PP2C family serine/threonine-protein phosphatase [Atopobiaceae bacterium]
MRYQTICATVLGEAHLRMGYACEDASGVLADTDAGWYALAVADGHGDTICSRSALGARFAVDAALDSLAAFARDMTGHPLMRNVTMDSAVDLKQRIVAVWHASCKKDLDANPMSEPEREGLQGRRNASSFYLYGTTLICALVIDDLCLLFQQGDGSCAFMDGKGNWTIPIDDDERCVGNITTSLSDADASESMRHAVIDGSNAHIAALMLASDGIEKSVSGNEALFDWLDGILPLWGKSGDATELQLENCLTSLSEQGSGDDASLAALVCPEALTDNLLSMIAARHHVFGLTSEAEQIRLRLISMQRKHDHLSRLWKDGRKDDAREYPDYHATYVQLQTRLAEIERGLLLGFEVDKEIETTHSGVEVPTKDDCIRVADSAMPYQAPSAHGLQMQASSSVSLSFYRTPLLALAFVLALIVGGVMGFIIWRFVWRPNTMIAHQVIDSSSDELQEESLIQPDSIDGSPQFDSTDDSHPVA